MDLRQICFVEWHDDNIRLVRSITWPLTYSSRLSSMSIGNARAFQSPSYRTAEPGAQSDQDSNSVEVKQRGNDF